ncbi:MAG TPA: septal ring lytic transglycosylase RlpA family protein [Cellvibrionaceae bacterium]
MAVLKANIEIKTQISIHRALQAHLHCAPDTSASKSLLATVIALGPIVLLAFVTGCASNKPGADHHKPEVSVQPSTAEKKGRYSLLDDQGPDTDIDVTNIPNAVPKKENRTIAGNLSPYTVLGKTYNIQFNAANYSQTGLASWYGKKFHGERTSNGEIYNMFAMTAAHKTLPIPCYVKVTNLANNKNVILRVNDRGPFHEDRVIDLTYTAAKKLDFHRAGTAKVRVEIVNLGDFAPLPIIAVKTDYGAKINAGQTGAAANIKALDPALINSSSLPKVSAQSAETVKPQSAPIKPPTARPSTTAMAPVYLQVGAFASQSGALALQKDLRSHTTLPIVLMPVQDKKIFRVLIGPLNDTNEMQSLKQKLIEKKLSTPYVVQAVNIK